MGGALIMIVMICGRVVYLEIKNSFLKLQIHLTSQTGKTTQNKTLQKYFDEIKYCVILYQRVFHHFNLY